MEETSRNLLPVIEEFEREHSGTVKVTKADVYKSAGIANRLGITTVPSVAFIRDGKLAGVLTEEITKEALEAAF